MKATRRLRFTCVPGHFGLFNVIDSHTGLPPDIDVTTVSLTRIEALRLIASLERGARKAAPDAANNWARRAESHAGA